LIVLGSSSNAGDNFIVGDANGTHAYAVVNYTASSSSPFELYNPWGVTSAVGSTFTWNGHQIYGGPFYANATLISQDFATQTLGNGAVARMDDLSNDPHQIATVRNTPSVPVVIAHDREQADGSLANSLSVSADEVADVSVTTASGSPRHAIDRVMAGVNDWWGPETWGSARW
jgi:hypothetical protein